MTTLTIKDLSSTETLDATTLKSVRGGLAVFAPRTSIFTPRYAHHAFEPRIYLRPFYPFSSLFPERSCSSRVVSAPPRERRRPGR